MKQNVNYGKKPSKYEIKNINKEYCLIVLRDNIKTYFWEGNIQYCADEYTLKTKVTSNLGDRVEKRFEDWLDYVKKKDYEETARKVREKRNALLAESDKEMVLDRLGVSQPSGSAFSDWLSFLQRISSVMFGEMARYRQDLRDITKQEGFPYDVKFPEKPKTK